LLRRQRFMDVPLKSTSNVGDVRRRLLSIGDLGNVHHSVADPGHRYDYQPARPRCYRFRRSADSYKFQPAYQAGRLLHAERLPGDSKSATESCTVSMEPNSG